MQLTKLEPIAGFFLATILSMPAWANTANTHTALPGTLNYVEGKVSIGTQALDSKSVGSAELQPGQELTTGKGKAEVLLTPGVFLRVGNNSSVQMISPSLTDTEVGVDKGHAMIEVAEIHPENYFRVSEQGVTTQLVKPGLYDFDLNRDQIRVFDGKALVEDGGKPVTVKGGREVSLDGNSSLQAQKFKKKAYQEGDLYRWSSLRSSYLAEANVDAAGMYIANGWGPWGLGWWGANWYWDPWFDAYTFIPGDGMFYSPFGWGFYSPWRVWQAPFYGSRFGYGHYYRHFSTNYRSWGPGSHYVATRNYAHGVYHGSGLMGGGIHSSRSGMAGSRSYGALSGGGLRGGGGFHGAGGGFHGR